MAQRKRAWQPEDIGMYSSSEYYDLLRSGGAVDLSLPRNPTDADIRAAVSRRLRDLRAKHKAGTLQPVTIREPNEPPRPATRPAAAMNGNRCTINADLGDPNCPELSVAEAVEQARAGSMVWTRACMSAWASMIRHDLERYGFKRPEELERFASDLCVWDLGVANLTRPPSASELGRKGKGRRKYARGIQAAVDDAVGFLRLSADVDPLPVAEVARTMRQRNGEWRTMTGDDGVSYKLTVEDGALVQRIGKRLGIVKLGQPLRPYIERSLGRRER